MLDKLMDMHILLYCMVAAGTLGVLGMAATHLTYRRRLKSTGHLSNLKEKWLNLWKSRDRLMRRMNRWVWYPSLINFLCLGAAIAFSASLKMEEGISLWYVYAGAFVPLLLLVCRQGLDFAYKEELLTDSLADYVDKTKKWIEEDPGENMSVEMQNEMVEQIAASIRETAAAGSRFSKMLSPEEEEIMREIIREFMT